MLDVEYRRDSATLVISSADITTEYDPSTKALRIIGLYELPDHEDHYMGDFSGVEHGFVYNGIHSSQFHVEYIPDESDRWFDGTDWEVYQSEVGWKNGGYYYGNAAKAKTFELKCFYEEITIKQREDIRNWLHRNTCGALLFDDMPFVYWNVRPTKIVPGNLYNDSGRYSGTFTVTLTAYEPFGYLTRKSNEEWNQDNANDYCDLIPTSEMPAEPTTASRTFDVYNPGREECGLSIKLSGTVSNPIEFLNSTNKTRCIIQSLPANDLILDINGDTCVIQTYVSGQEANADYGYAYHDRGIIKLDPGLNHIEILEKNNNGEWVVPTTLSMTRLGIDYAPRIL